MSDLLSDADLESAMRAMMSDRTTAVAVGARKVRQHIDALQQRVAELEKKLDEIAALGVDPVARDKGAHFIACRMLAIAGSSHADGAEHG